MGDSSNRRIRRSSLRFQNVDLYGNPGCGLCKAAEQLLNQKGIAYTFTNIHTENQAKGQEIRDKYHPTRYPYVFIKGAFIGGRDELEKLLKDLPNSPNANSSSPPPSQPAPAVDVKSAKIELFVNPNCGFCQSAEQLLRGQGIPFTLTDISSVTGNPEKRTQVLNAYGAQTYPYVVVNGQYIGGFMQLQALVSKNSQP